MFNINVLATCFGCEQPSLGQIYVHLVDLRNEYLCAMGPHVALQDFGNIYMYNECLRVAVQLLLDSQYICYQNTVTPHGIP
jgi:hypothetical protein